MKAILSDKNAMIYLIFILLPLFSFAGPRSIASLDTPQSSFNSCIKSLIAAPTTPEFPKNYFQKMGGEENFTLRCHLPDGDEFVRFAFIGEHSIKSLKLPIYYYKHFYKDGTYSSTDLPRNVIHFKYQNKDYYIELEYADVANIVTAEKLPEIAEKNLFPVSKIHNEYVKKYETWLKSNGQEKAIVLTEATLNEQDILKACFEEKKSEIYHAYIQAKYLGIIPTIGVMVRDSRKYNSLSFEEKQKYQKPWSELESTALMDLSDLHPNCDGVISEEMQKEAFEKAFGKNKAYYDDLRMLFFN